MLREHILMRRTAASTTARMEAVDAVASVPCAVPLAAAAEATAGVEAAGLAPVTGAAVASHTAGALETAGGIVATYTALLLSKLFCWKALPGSAPHRHSHDRAGIPYL